MSGSEVVREAVEAAYRKVVRTQDQPVPAA